ncbi:MAG: site-specific DNA-methyltransferase [Candidatus Gastranaerophilales bacterium]|nr:site-specific DNA-methyltransferase [Candidatus Gastranaerophilales bacterium]
MARQKNPITTAAVPVKSYKHEGKRVRIPTQEESIKMSPRDKKPVKKMYDYDPSLDPQLIWAGKKEQGAEFGVATVPIYVQEKVAPEAIIARLKLGAKEDAQQVLFGDTAETQFGKAVDFYKHEDNWQNRMILGDSLLVMNSLLEKEGMRGRIQTIYIDPPYGIKFGSNWQVSTRKRDVKDNRIEDFVRQPEQVKAFRDTWELGIHSYLSYLRDRLITARALLTESGSCFVQINDENVHLIRNLMDEVFDSVNFVGQIPFSTTSGFSSKYIDSVVDYIVWYGKDISKTKYRQIYKEKTLGADGSAGYDFLEMSDGSIKPINEFEDITKLPEGSRLFTKGDLLSKGPACVDQTFEFQGKNYKPNENSHWKAKFPDGMKKLAELGRIIITGNTLRYMRYFDDFPFYPLTNIWSEQLSEQNKDYVVQTAAEVIKRCLLMTSDPGDIVLDPTCGGGTTAYVSEQWGRRWITIDTSRVSLALARCRLMTAKFPYYKLKDEKSVSGGFIYKTVPHVTLKSLANDEPAEEEVLYDQPTENKEIVRVTGPFTVESLSPHRVSDAQEMLSSERFVETVVDNLLKAGVQTGQKGARVEFANLDILPQGPEVQAVGEYKTESGLKRVAVAIGPEFGSVDDDFVRDAATIAKKFADLLVVAATSFEASAFSERAQSNGIQIMKVKINPDLSMGDLLKKTGSGNLFLAFGEPEVRVNETKEGITVEVVGVDIYDPVKSEIRSSGSGDPEHEIAAWFIDTNYNGEAFFVTHAYFLGADKPYDKLKRALKADINESAWEELYKTVSRPFPKPKTEKIAVKVINHYGDEVMKIVEIE